MEIDFTKVYVVVTSKEDIMVFQGSSSQLEYRIDDTYRFDITGYLKPQIYPRPEKYIPITDNEVLEVLTKDGKFDL